MRKFLVNIDGKEYQVGVEEITDGVEVTPVVTEVKATPATAPATPKATPKAPVNVNGTKMESPMPGMIKSLAVAEGSTVKKGQTVVVLEAMKMDNDLPAPCDGVISFRVSKGANVETGDVIAVIG